MPRRVNLPYPLAVHITTTAFETIAREASRSEDGLETGGILLGHDTPDQVLIRHAGDPGPNADRGSRHFHRDLEHAQHLATAAWNNDQSLWLGEWHTHPGAGPTPSSVDLNSYLRHLNDPDLGFDRFVAIIVTFDDTAINAVAWVVDRNHCRPVPIQTVPPLAD
jgi:integrative and conjugative element protein (TIGR02256 family)